MALTAGDWEVIQSTKVIDYTGGDHDNSPTYATVIELHRWLQDLADDPYHTPADDDEVDISTLDPSARSTDNIITLKNGYTLGPRAVEHLYDGSIIESGGDTIYDGIVNYGNASVQIHIMQDGEVISDDYWNQSGAGINADATAGISHRFMIKVRDDGADIDGRKLIGLTREFNTTDGYTFSEFVINSTSRGNNVLALVNTDDLNNEKSPTTIAGYTDITNTEGLRLIDVNNNATDEEYWSEWDKGTRTINDLYERMKWISKAPLTEDSCSDSGSDFIIDNATITGAAQSFTVGSNAMMVTKVTANLKKTLSPTGNITCTIYSHSGTYGTSSVPNAQTGTVSDPVDAATLTTTYETTTFHFPSPVDVSASTYYCVVFEHADGDASNYVQIEGLASSGTHSGNRSHNTAGWTAAGSDDLAFEVYTSMKINTIPGFWMRGATHSVPYDAESGTPGVTHNEHLVWGTRLLLTSITGTPTVGECVYEDVATPTWYGRVLAWDVTNSYLLIRVDSGSSDVPANADGIRNVSDAFNATINAAPDFPQVSNYNGGDLLTLAFDDDGSAGNIYGQLMKGTSPNDNDLLYDSTDLTDYYTASANASSYTVSTPFCGASTGSAIIGSYGFGVEYADLTNADLMRALDDVTYQPPNNVTNYVGGLETTGSSEDYVMVAPWDGSTTDTNGDPAIDTGQMLIATSALTTANVATVNVGNGTETAIPSDTPSAGWIRVEDDDGYYRRLKYSSWSGTAFTIDTTWHTSNDNQNDFDGAQGSGTYQASIGNNVYVTYLDEISTSTPLSYTGVYSSDRDLVVIVRNGNTGYLIKQFISEWSFTNSSQTINAIHTSDT